MPDREASGSKEHTIFVGQLKRETTEQDLRDHFEKFGATGFRIASDRDTGACRGFGFVVFNDMVSAAKVISETHMINGKECRVQTSGQDSAAGGDGKSSMKTKTIFVGSIPLEASSEELKEYFEKFGKISNSYIIKDRNTKESKGFGFVTYENEDTVDLVMSEPHMLGGRELRLEKSEAKDREQPPQFRIQSQGMMEQRGRPQAPMISPHMSHPGHGNHSGRSDPRKFFEEACAVARNAYEATVAAAETQFRANVAMAQERLAQALQMENGGFGLPSSSINSSMQQSGRRSTSDRDRDRGDRDRRDDDRKRDRSDRDSDRDRDRRHRPY